MQHPLLVAFFLIFAFEPTFGSVASAQNMGQNAPPVSPGIAPTANAPTAAVDTSANPPSPFDLQRDLPKLVALAERIVKPVAPFGEKLGGFLVSVVPEKFLGIPNVIGTPMDMRRTLLSLQGRHYRIQNHSNIQTFENATTNTPSKATSLVQQTTCRQPQILVNGQCVDCPDGYIADDNAAVCVACDDATYRKSGMLSCQACDGSYQVASSDHTKCINDGIATYAFTGVMTLYLVTGFLRLLSVHFLNQNQNSFCCCLGGQRDKQPCARTRSTFFSRAADHCPDTDTSEGKEVIKLLDGEQFPLTMHDRVCRMTDQELEKGSVTVVGQRTKHIVGLGIYGMLMLGSIAAGFVSALLDNHWAVIAFTAAYFVASCIVYGFSIKKKYDTGAITAVSTAVEVIFMVVELGILIWFAVRVARPQVRSTDISLMWLMQLTLQFQIAFLADMSFQKGDSGFSRKVFGFVVAVMLLEAIFYPLSIAMRILTWSKPDEDPMSEAELVNQHYTADYFGTMVSGMAIAIAVVERTNERMGELQTKREHYDRVRLSLIHRLNFIMMELHPARGVKYSTNYLVDDFDISKCVSVANPGSEADVFEKKARHAMVEALGQMEEEDICGFFQVVEDRGDGQGALKPSTPSQPIQLPSVGGAQAEVPPSTPSAEDTSPSPEASEFLAALGFEKMCPDINNGAMTCKDKECETKRCRKVAIMAKQLPTYIKRFNRGIKVRALSTNFLVMAMVACSYFGGVYNVMDMSLNIRAQHAGNPTNVFNNSISTMVLAFIICVLSMVFMFSNGEDDEEEKTPEEPVQVTAPKKEGTTSGESVAPVSVVSEEDRARAEADKKKKLEALKASLLAKPDKLTEEQRREPSSLHRPVTAPQKTAPKPMTPEERQSILDNLLKPLPVATKKSSVTGKRSGSAKLT